MMRNVISSALLLLGLLPGFCCNRNDESVAIAKLAESFNPKPLGWSIHPTTGYCLWLGVTCDDSLSGNITYIKLNNMSLSGSLPSPFPDFPYLKALDLSDNNLSGEVPSLANLPSLENLCLNNNRFNRLAHDFILQLPTSLTIFDLGDNPFLLPWTIPKQFSRLQNLQHFRSQNAGVTGTLPDIFHSSSLLTLSLSHNSLNGALPQSIGASKIEVLELAHQKMKLTGTIQVFAAMSTLSQLHLEDNRFTGPIPDFSGCKNLIYLFMGNNQLTGPVPTSLASLADLYNISLSSNKLQGPFPSFLLQKPLLYATLDGNNFCTYNHTSHCDERVDALLEIAGAFGYPLRLSDAWKGNDACQNWGHVRCNSRREIVTIDFGKQYFGGTISPSFSKLGSLQYLYLNDNNLTGFIPETLLYLPNLILLDVSNNNLFGDIPSFKSSVKLITTGNPRLRNVALAKAKEKRKKVIIAIVAILVTITCGICIYFTGMKTNRHTGTKNMDGLSDNEACLRVFSVMLKEKGHIKLQDLQMISLEELVTATDGFNPTNKLGQGGFSSVYKGKMKDGRKIAVKRLSNASGQGLEEFMNEVVVISKLQHKNLVRFLGCCITGDEKLLVYEYMPNKSLDAFLFDHDKQKVLDWEKRYQIIKGISRGILYLHSDSGLRIIHRDLKASNILLDEDLIPKISDFGMAIIFGGNEDHANTHKVMGTYGYMPPEYVMEGRFSERSDIYSFGVLILEIVSGRRNLSPDDDKGLSLLEHAWTLWKGNLISALIDPVIPSSDSNEEILRCIHVGLLCVQDLVKDRPTISMVISMLGNEIKHLPQPRESLFLAREAAQSQCQSTLTATCLNEDGVSLTIMEGR